MFEQAISLYEKGQVGEAASLCRQIIAKDPKNAAALNLLGLTEYRRGKALEAVKLIDLAIKIWPDNATFFNNRGLALQRLRRLDEALESFERALTIKPDYAEAMSNRGDVLFALNRLEDAIASYNRALECRPSYSAALNNRGVALQRLKRPEEAIASFDRALAIRSDYFQALANRGNALFDLRRLPEALDSLNRALAIKPDSAETLNSRGNVLQELRRMQDALASYDRAVAIRSDYAEAWNNRGLVLLRLGRLEEALESYDRAVAGRGDFADAHANRGDVLYNLKRFDKALESYDRALALAPNLPFLMGRRVFCKKRICDWHEEESDFNTLAAMVDRGERTTPLFAALASPLSSVQLKNCAERYITNIHPRNPVLPVISRRHAHDRMRLGYFSSDFWNHPVAHLIAGLLENHDRRRFEVTGFSLGPRKTDWMRARVERACDRFVELDQLSDIDAVTASRNLEIDIAIDLNGFTANARTGLFAMGIAPIQVNYLGYPGTMGADYFDYIIADEVVIPETDRRNYTEKIAYLPDSYQPGDSKRMISDRPFTRAEFSLPDEGVVFCCFNNHYKVASATFGIWMRLLKQVPGSVLWLSSGSDTARRNLSREAEGRGVERTRLVFATFVPKTEDHLARLKLADLFLDTLPFNAHATASDALWAGVPVLTCLGETFQGRVAASLLFAVGLPELVTDSPSAYERLARDLATNPERLSAIRRKLEANRLNAPLFDTARFAHHIEEAYATMWQRYHSGLRPDHFHVAASS